MADKRERRCQMLVALLSTWSLFTLLLSGARLHLGGVWGEPDMDSLREILSHPRFYGQFILVVTMIFLVPTSCSRRTVADVLHFITQMCGMVGLLFHSDVLVFWEDVYVVTVQRLFFALFSGNSQLVLALNTVHAACLCVRIAASNVLEFDVPFLLAQPIVCVITSLMVESYTRSDAVAQLTAVLSSNNETTVQNLLNMMCDAVVLLDEDLKVKTSSPQFDALLLRQTKPDELCGTSFPMFLHESDQQRFRECAQDVNGNGRSIHVDVQDSGGSRLTLQLFHCCFKDLFAQTCHIVGVREEYEATMQREVLTQSGPSQLFVPPLPTLRDASSSASSRSDEFVPIRSCDEERIAVWFDIFSEELRILSCTAGFTCVGGPIQE